MRRALPFGFLAAYTSRKQTLATMRQVPLFFFSVFLFFLSCPSPFMHQLVQTAVAAKFDGFDDRLKLRKSDYAKVGGAATSRGLRRGRGTLLRPRSPRPPGAPPRRVGVWVIPGPSRPPVSRRARVFGIMHSHAVDGSGLGSGPFHRRCPPSLQRELAPLCRHSLTTPAPGHRETAPGRPALCSTQSRPSQALWHPLRRQVNPEA